MKTKSTNHILKRMSELTDVIRKRERNIAKLQEKAAFTAGFRAAYENMSYGHPYSEHEIDYNYRVWPGKYK